MTWLVPLPVVLPLVAAAVSIMVGGSRKAQRIVGVATLATLAVVSIALLVEVDRDGVLVAEAGDWPGPLGIVLVADRFAATLLVVAEVALLAVLVYAIGIDGESAPTFRQAPMRPRPPAPPFPWPGGGRMPGGGRFPGLFSQVFGQWQRGDDRVNASALRDMTDDNGGRTEIIRSARDLEPSFEPSARFVVLAELDGDLPGHQVRRDVAREALAHARVRRERLVEPAETAQLHRARIVMEGVRRALLDHRLEHREALVGVAHFPSHTPMNGRLR